MNDRYSQAVEHFTKNPGRIPDAWSAPNKEDFGFLFAYATPSGGDCSGRYGCLTMIRRGTHVAWTDTLTKAIRADQRIPIDLTGLPITGNVRPTLEVFAEWQRRLDAEIRSETYNQASPAEAGELVTV